MKKDKKVDPALRAEIERVKGQLGDARIVDMHAFVAGEGCSVSRETIARIMGKAHFPARAVSYLMGLSDRYLGSSKFPSMMGNRIIGALEHSLFQPDIVALAMDYAYDSDGKKIGGGVYIPNSFVSQLPVSFPGIHPSISIHPCNPDYEIQQIDFGWRAVAMKLLLSSQNINLRNDQQLERIARTCTAYKTVPIIHAAPEGAIPHPREWDKGTTSPDVTEFLVEELGKQSVNVVLAHCAATGTFYGAHTAGDDKTYQTFLSMIGRHKHLYGDISSLLGELRGHIFADIIDRYACGDRLPMERLVFGTDLPATVGDRAVKTDIFVGRKQLIEKQAGYVNRTQNPFDKEILLTFYLLTNVNKGDPKLAREVLTRAYTVMPKLNDRV